MTTTPNFIPYPSDDAYIYTYKCGHSLKVPGVRMARGGQVVPPLCPECHGQAEIDKMEYENWRLDPNWTGFLSGEVSGESYTHGKKKSFGSTGNRTWLDIQLQRVTVKAWG